MENLCIKKIDRKYITLNDINARRLAENDVKLFFETYIASEIIKSCCNVRKKLDLYYYRDIDKKEIDLLIDKGDKLHPTEIKKAKNPSHADKNFEVLKVFKKTIEPGLIICMNDDLIPYDKKCLVLPDIVNLVFHLKIVVIFLHIIIIF